MSFRTRLLLSYALVILTCVAIIFAALVFLLRDAPVQQRLTAARLSVEANVVTRALRTPLQNGVGPEQLVRRLQNLGERTDTRILIVNQQNGQVLGDTAGTLAGTNLFTASHPQRFNNILSGEFDDGGQHWLYATSTLPGLVAPFEVVAALPYEAAPLFRDPVFLELLRPLLIAALLALGVSIVLAFLVTRSVTRPMQHVAQAAQKIAAGNYDQVVPVEGPQEFKEVAVDFNQMAQKVRDTQQSQRDLVANVSHELKTPLTSIQGFAQAIKDGAASEPEAIHKSAAIIYDEAARMNRMVGELLDLARIETGQIVMRREAIAIDQVLRSVVEKLLPRAQESGIALQISITDNLPALAGDGDRLAQVFSNLIDNALKHTPSGGKVTVAARALSGSSVVRKGKPWPGGVEVTVSDTGSGIPPEDLSRIFERFYQVDKSRARSKSGASLGLGLAIVKEIVTAHGGTIHAESVVGLGTKFVVWLPVARAPNP